MTTAGRAGANIDSTGAFAWLPTQDQVGSQQISLVVTDKNGGSTTQSFSVAVAAFDDLPIIGGTPDTTALEDQAYTYARPAGGRWPASDHYPLEATLRL